MSKYSLTSKRIKEIAVDFAEGKIFSNLHVQNQNDLSSVFMIMIFLNEEQRQELVDDDIIFMYEYFDKANPISVNGYPTFFSCHFMTKEDFYQMWVEYQKYVEIRQQFLDDYEPHIPINFGERVLTQEDINKYKLNS